MCVRGRRGIKTVEKAMNRRKTSWICFPAPLGPSIQVGEEPLPRGGEGVQLTGTSGRSSISARAPGRWSSICATLSKGPTALGCHRGHRLLAKPVTHFHLKHLFVPTFQRTHYNHVESGCFGLLFKQFQGEPGDQREKVLLQSNVCWPVRWRPLLRHKSKAVSNCRGGPEVESSGLGWAGAGREGRS